jgi:hypothetical protein
VARLVLDQDQLFFKAALLEGAVKAVVHPLPDLSEVSHR